jgi:hypothetical protein
MKDLVKYPMPDANAAVNLIKEYITKELGCSTDCASSTFCSVITLRGSYHGFPSMMLCIQYPDYYEDIGYASIAPLDLYSQVVNLLKRILV